MEWLDGSTLREFMRSGPLGLNEVLPIADQLTSALDAAHAAGVIHRDLKASNVMLINTPYGVRVKLVDFGIAKAIDPQEAARHALTTTGQALGTPYTMAPEQITGRVLDARTDVYALGVVLFEMLTGVKPFDGTSAIEVAEKHLREEPPRASDVGPVPPAVDAVLQRCLAKAPDIRFPTPKAVARALHEAAAASPPAPVRAALGAHVSRQLPAMGLYFNVRYIGQGQPDDDVTDDLLDLMEDAVAQAQAIGLRLAVRTGTSFLAVLPVPDAGPRSLEMRSKVIELALYLAEELPAHLASRNALEIHAVVHCAPVETAFRNGTTVFVGGELLDVARWVHDDSRAALTATEKAVAGMEELLDTEKIDGLTHLRVLGLVR
jgi:serine/threonine-protein kinase